jgi:hypothetical protein
VKGLKPKEFVLSVFLKLGDEKLAKLKGIDFEEMLACMLEMFPNLDEESAWTAMSIGVFEYVKWRVMCTTRKGRGRLGEVNLTLNYLMGFLLRPEGHSQRKQALKEAANAGEKGFLVSEL